MAVVAGGLWQDVGAQERAVPVRGVVFDSLRGEPLRDAQVVILGVGKTIVTDTNGRFHFDSVPVGTHTIVMQHAVLDAIGTSGISRRLIVSGELTDVRIGVPSFASLWSRACGGTAPSDSGFVYGTISSAMDGMAASNVIVAVTWTETKYHKSRGVTQRFLGRSTRSDARGGYVICGVPVSQWMRVEAGLDSLESGRIELPPVELRVQRRDVSVGLRAAADSSRRGTIMGVLFDVRGAPLSEARIVLDDSSETRSNGDGRFVFRNVYAGTRQVEVLSLGMLPVLSAVEVYPRDTAAVSLQLRRVTALDVVRVTASSRGRVLAAALEERRKSGFGYAMDMTELEGYRSFSNVLKELPGVRVDYQRGNNEFLANVSDGRGGNCALEVWVDGARMSQAALNMIRPEEAMAIELYARASTLPLQFRRNERNMSCGAILVWTRWAFGR